MLALQRAAGNRAVAAAVQRTLTNDATWSPVDATTGQGTHVVAIVGPGHEYGSGPKNKPGFRPYDYTSMFSAATEGAFYCQGHLLNDNLGGPGDPNVAHADENLTAFPQRPTNTDHNKAIEQWVKAAAKNSWFSYTVSIGYSTDSAARLRRRLGASAGLAAGAGIATTATTFSYASSLSASWDELVQGPAASNAAPPVKPGGISGTLNISIPSPMTYLAPLKRAGEYPGYTKKSWQHLTTMKDYQTSFRTGVLPPGGARNPPPSPGRPHVVAVRWQANDDARAGVPLPVNASAVYKAGYNHYNEGVTASRAGPPGTRYGRGYTMGYQDFDAGITHGRAHAQASPPTPPPQATVDGHNEFWAGVLLGVTKALTTPPVGNRAHVTGHADYWAGVDHARKNPKATAPKNLGQGAGHTHYWEGVEFAAANPRAIKPAGNLAIIEGHTAYWKGADAARADPTTAPPLLLGDLKGHTDYIDGGKHAQGNPRTTPPAAGAAARTEAWTEYWQGVDFARANPAGTPYTGPSSAAKVGVTDYRAGSDQAHKDLASLSGAVPTISGAVEGFNDYRAGVDACRDGKPTDAARPGFDRGWQACQAGITDGSAGTPVARTDGGYATGYLHAQGAMSARAGQPAPVGGLEETIRAGGHAGYHTGMAAARADLNAAKPPQPAAAHGHTDYLDGVRHGRGNPHTAPPATGAAARTEAWTEYCEGVDFAQANPAGTAYTGPSSAAKAGVADYWAGLDRAAGGLPALLGPAPTGGGNGTGFGDYHAGVLAFIAGTVAIPGRAGHATGHQHAQAGDAEAAHLVATKAPLVATRTEAGFLYGFSYRVGVAAGQADLTATAPTGDSPEVNAVAAAGLAAYTAGYRAGRAGGPATTDLGGAAGHADYQTGLTHAKANPRTTAPTGPSATMTAFTEYWAGVDFGQANPATTPYTGPSSATQAGATDYRAGVQHAVLQPSGTPPPARSGAAQGATDYWQGEAHAVTSAVPPGGAVASTTAFAAYYQGANHARASLPNLQGAPPVGRVEALGFTAYANGVHDADNGLPDNPASIAFSQGWSDYDAGEADIRAGQVVPQQPFSGYLVGFQNTRPPVAKRRTSGSDLGHMVKKKRR